MKTYRLKIKPESSFLTPWQADTVFGSLCWALVWTEGEKALEAFLENYINNDPVVILSNGFPGDLLPAPAHLALLHTKVKSVDEYQKVKKYKKLKWLKLEDFEKVIKGETDKVMLEAREPLKIFTTVHNTINRFTGTTGEEGSLYELEEYVLKEEFITIYLKIKNGWEEKILNLFKTLSKLGFGRKRSIGKGEFKIISELESFDRFDKVENFNAFVSLSNFVPSEDDPTEGFYNIFVKYGKLGGEFTFTGNPFKKPILMIREGSVFKVNGKIRLYYGCLIPEIAPGKPEVVQYAYAFPVPAKL